MKFIKQLKLQSVIVLLKENVYVNQMEVKLTELK